MAAPRTRHHFGALMSQAMPHPVRSALAALAATVAMGVATPSQADTQSLEASDGTRLHAIAKGAEGKKGVVLVHMLGRVSGASCPAMVNAPPQPLLQAGLTVACV